MYSKILLYLNLSARQTKKHELPCSVSTHHHFWCRHAELDVGLLVFAAAPNQKIQAMHDYDRSVDGDVCFRKGDVMFLLDDR